MLKPMISVIHAIILGLVQGITELFPISSLGHSVIIPQLFNWHIQQNGSYYVTFLVGTHFATALVLCAFFWRDWVKIISGLIRSFKARRIDLNDSYAKIGWLLVVATVPAGILGLLFQDSLSKLFTSAKIASILLAVNGVILFGAERIRKNRQTIPENVIERDKGIAKLHWRQAIGIGIFQSASLFPGISRSGSTMAGSLVAGLNNEEAARFSFLLATPIILAASVLKLPEVFSKSYINMRVAILVGAICAALAAYLSVAFLIRYFRTKTLTPFAIYCFVAGISLSLYFFLR
jgi:undecaprenyl-diphosphatase